MKKFLIFVVLCIIVGGGLFFTLAKKPKQVIPLNKNEEIALPIQILKNTSFNNEKSFIGFVQAIQTVEIVPYLSGFLKEVRVQSGEEVKKGQTLFLLDDRIPLANLEQAKEIVAQAQATRTNAEVFYQRTKNTEAKAISQTELEQAKTEFEASEAAYQKALAAQHQAQTLYDYTTVQAPISGWVGNITATPGEYLSPEGKTLATIVRFSPIRLVFSVPMSSYHDDSLVNKAMLKIVLSNGKILNFNNFKVSRDNHVDQSTDAIPFFIDVKNEERHLIPGAYVEIKLISSETGILINKNWVNLTPEGAEAFILKNGIIEKRNIEIKAPINHQYWVKSGLVENDALITVPVKSDQIGKKAKGVHP